LKSSQTVYFNDFSQSYYDVVNWTWDFGDGNFSYTQNTSHTYAADGFYNVTLTITDNMSASNVTTQQICIDSVNPEITSCSGTPDTTGCYTDIDIDVNANDDLSGIDIVKINVIYPNNSNHNFTLNNTNDSLYELVFNDSWLVGQYNYTIYVFDKSNNSINSTGHNFNISMQGSMSVCTIKDSYGNNEMVNLTDPPSGSAKIGYELLDDDKVLHIWNRFGSYYFDTSSGIQLTNHYDDYWTHNVLMLGYYNNNQWNLIYRADELSGFIKEIDCDNETFVNATLWKDLSYGGYDFRLAIRYNLGVNDNELTVIPYIKNLDQDDIPYVLGFGWEMKDIQIDMTEIGDYINVNNTMYYLNQTLDNIYTDLQRSEFYLMENITDTETKSLYLKWDNSLNYKLQVKSRIGQYNAPVTLFIKVGTLDSGQEKYTELFWYDAEQVTYYFDGYDDSPFGEAWPTNPGYMVDGSSSSYASTTSDGDVELCDSNNCSGTDLGTISKVELRVCSYCPSGQRNTILRPVFGGTADGMECRYQTSGAEVWSQWFDITYDPFAPQSWSWSDVVNLDCDVIAENDPVGPPFTLKCSKIELRVTYTPYNYDPVVSSPVPSNDATGVSIQPVLNITVNDQDGDAMNVTWLSNSGGSWQTFGTNNSVSNGTYHQTMSNASVNGQWWHWKVNVSDGTEYVESNILSFYTGYQSKIENTGSTNFTGYLLMQIEFYNTTNSTWILEQVVVNESTSRTINAGCTLALDTIFNPYNVSTSSFTNGDGTYRVYVSFRDPDRDVLVCDDVTLLEDSYQFTVSTS
jgi:PKD repeat protein